MTAAEALSIQYDDAGVIKTIFTLPSTKRPDLPSVYAFSLPKAGSVLLDKIMSALAEQVGMTYVSLMGELFSLGLAERDIPSSVSRIFVERGYCYGGFRSYPKRFEIPNLATKKCVLLLRDPRDMLVSHYFSMRSSHATPGRALKTSRKSLPHRDRALVMSLDDYVLDFAKQYARQLNRYIDVLDGNRDSFTVFRYEDVIFNKRAWVTDICHALGWDVSDRTRNKIADKNDVVPRTENEAKHIRQVAPGDGMRKLHPATIEKLNALFEAQLAYFGYSADYAPNGRD